MRGCACLVLTLACIAPSSPAQGRGDYQNFETPQVKPISVARVGGRDFVLACNTADSSLEVRDAAQMRIVARIKTGLEPVSVVFDAQRSRAYTCNMLGDSISVIDLAYTPARGLSATLVRTDWVGDEPMMIATAFDGRVLFVTHNRRGAFSVRDADTLAPLAPGALERIDLVDDWQRPLAGIKEPRVILRRGSQVFVLGFRGGHSFFHDFDLYGLDLTTLAISKLGGLGTIKANMAFASNGELWVVGGDAQNQLVGLKALRTAPTGFVESLVHRVRGAGSQGAKVERRDLNEVGGKAVPKTKALAHPTDLALLEESNAVVKVFVAAFSSDRVGVVEPGSGGPATWKIRTIDIKTASGARSKMAGPRGLALKPANPGQRDDPGPRLYVLNRLDASITVIDPDKEIVIATHRLAHDPTPDYIVRARHFLYSAELSGNGFVSCSSCHLDGATDGLAWSLNEPASNTPRALPTELLDGVTESALRGVKSFPLIKGRMVTQPMQGLVNAEVAPESQALFSNEPRHWRADQDFLAFNGAYVDLQGMPNLAPKGKPSRGIKVEEMRAYEVFAHSIHLPPNPEQPWSRVYSGSLGDPDKSDGSGALRGLKLFHTDRIEQDSSVDPILAGRSCVQCHSLPEGSNNRITRLGISTPQPMETAMLRGIAQKEAVLEKNGSTQGSVVLGEFGTEHQGTLRSINDFNSFVFGHQFRGSRAAMLDAITQFTREFDTGTAPLVGVPFTIDAAAAKSPLVAAVAAFFEGQARLANVSVVAQLHAPKGYRGFYYSPSRDTWIEEASGTALGRSALLALVKKDAPIVMQCVPLGDERRLAAASGKARVLKGAAPRAIRLEPMRPQTAWRDVPKLTKNWKPGAANDPMAFVWSGVWSGTSVKAPQPLSLLATRLLQYGLIQDAGFKIRLRHEAPRRLRVSGFDIRPGAELVLFVPNDPKLKPPYKLGQGKLLPIRVPIYASALRRDDGAAIYESAAELEPTLVYVLALGGPSAPGVAAALGGKLSEPPAKGSFDPTAWNRHWVFVRNEDGSFASGGWQRIRID